MTRWLSRALVIAFAPLAAAPPAAAATVPTCDSLPNPIYIQMGSTQVNLIKRMGRALRDDPNRPMTLVYISSGSCTNIDNFYHHTAALTQNMSYMPSKAEDPSWTPD